jgi:hypothetical protein
VSKPLFVYVVAAARKIWGWSPAVQALRKTPRICAACGAKEKAKPTRVEKFHKDHIDPVGKAPRTWDGWDAYYKRMFVPVERLQWLCQPCHKKKTAKERKEGKYA